MSEYMAMLYSYTTTGIQVFVGFYFLTRLLHRKIKFYFYLLFGGTVVWSTCLVESASITQLGIFILLLAAAGILLCHADWKTAVLYAILIVEIMQLCYGIVKSLSSILYVYFSALDQNIVGVSFMLMSEMAALVLTGFCYCLVQRYFSNEIYSFDYEIIKKQYIFLIFIPILMIFIMDEYINSFIYGMVVTDEYGTEIYFYTNHYQMLVIQLLGLGSIFCILFAYKKVLRSFRLNTELSLLEQKEHSLNQYVEEAKAHYDETKSFRHDIKNHIAVVKKLLQDGKLEQALNYMDDMDDMAEKMSFPCNTNNPVVDILVENKLGIAKSMGICGKCSLFLPYPCGLRDIDICIVLSNALDNAIHACKNIKESTEKYIHISGRIQGDFLMIEIKNSVSGKSKLKNGTGLSNIKTVAEKYGGAMNIDAKENVFVLQVLLIIPRYSESISHQMN